MKRRSITAYLILPGEYLGGNCFALVSFSRGDLHVDAFMRESSRRVPVLGSSMNSRAP